MKRVEQPENELIGATATIVTAIIERVPPAGRKIIRDKFRLDDRLTGTALRATLMDHGSAYGLVVIGQACAALLPAINAAPPMRLIDEGPDTLEIEFEDAREPDAVAEIPVTEGSLVCDPPAAVNRELAAIAANLSNIAAAMEERKALHDMARSLGMDFDLKADINAIMAGQPAASPLVRIDADEEWPAEVEEAFEPADNIPENFFFENLDIG